ncbi:MAG: acetate--CoA ligase family protein, partial [Myxococcota bacterium]|nr:acetate--CoA ligase family protein [Myxococcota bacterium]
RAASIAARRRASAGDGPGTLTLAESLDLMGSYGIPVAPTEFPASIEGALDAAARLGYPVVAKVDSPAIVHRTDVHGVVLGIPDEVHLVRAWRRLSDLIRDNAGGDGRVAIQREIPDAKETILGMTLDPMFGPLIHQVPRLTRRTTLWLTPKRAAAPGTE